MNPDVIWQMVADIQGENNRVNQQVKVDKNDIRKHKLSAHGTTYGKPGR